MNAFAAVPSGGTGVTCGRVAGLTANPATAFTADCLGFSKHPGTPMFPCGRPATGQGQGQGQCCGGPESACLPAPCPLPAAYEAGSLFQFTSPGLPTAGVVQARVVRAQAGYAVGTATNVTTGLSSGLLTWVGLGANPDPGVRPTVLLEFPSPQGSTFALQFPRALAVFPDVVVVVGSGRVSNTATGTLIADRQPMLAVVPASGCALGSPTMCAGNGAFSSGSPQFLGGMEYYDVLPNPCDRGATLYVCGVGYESEMSQPLPVVLLVGWDGMALAAASFPSSAVAVSIALTECLVSVAINKPAPSGTAAQVSIWSLVPGTLASVAPVPLLSGTQYNDPLSGIVRLPPVVTSLVAVRLVAGPQGTLFLVGRGTTTTSGSLAAGLPPVCLVILAFSADTTPNTTYGEFGAITWGVPDGGATASTQPTDACLQADGSLAIGGNAFVAGTSTVVYPSLPHLTTASVDVGTGAADGAGPWLLTVGNPCGVAVNSCAVPARSGTCGVSQVWPAAQCLVWGLGGCKDLRLLNATMVARPGVLAGVGDVFGHLGCAAQPAGLLDVVVTTTTCPPRLLNARPLCTSGPCWGSCAPLDGGPLRVDYCCGEGSALAVAGPITLCGQTAPPVPVVAGTLWFNAATNQFQAYDNNGNVRSIAFTS
jgi:hypothetical protein